MPVTMGIALGIGCATLVAFAILLLVRIRTLSKSYVYTVKGKEVVVRYGFRYGAQIFVNGVLEEQFCNSHASRFTLHATIEGGEFKAHIQVLGSVKIESYYQGALLPPNSVGK